MVRVLTYSVLLIVGMVLSQLPRHPSFEARDCSAHNELSSVHIDSSRMEFEIDKTDLRKYGIVYLVAMASRSLSTGRLQIARQQLTYLAICNLPYAAHLSKTNLFRSPAAGIRLALRILQISQF